MTGDRPKVIAFAIVALAVIVIVGILSGEPFLRVTVREEDPCRLISKSYENDITYSTFDCTPPGAIRWYTPEAHRDER